jgi:hypothetical protein
VICVRIKRVSKSGERVVWLVTVPTILRALELVPGEVIFPLNTDEFFHLQSSGRARATEVTDEEVS